MDETVSVTVVDDDTLGLMASKTEVSTSEDAADAAANADDFTVRLGTLPSAVVTVAISSSDTGEGGGFLRRA